MILSYSVLSSALRSARNHVAFKCATSPNCFHTSVSSLAGEVNLQEEPLVLVDRVDKITLFGINRPSKKNALNYQLLQLLRSELRKFEEDDSSVVGVLYGVGGNFCSGLDLQEVASGQQSISIPLVDELCKKPMVASINGYAVGEGFDLAMACDIRVVEDVSILGVFNRRFGVPMSRAAISRLTASVGLTIALEFILTGRPIDGKEAFKWGLASRLTSCGAGRGEALTAAQNIVKYPQPAMLADRAAVYCNYPLPDELQRGFQQEYLTCLPEAKQMAQSGAQRFFEGVGKKGTFKNLTEQTDRPEWMKS